MKHLALFFALLLAACGSAAEPVEPTDTTEATDTTGEEAPPDETPAERPSMSAEECTAAGGTVVGDIGDGATQRPDYVCESGQPPIGTVPLGIEGSVCCPQ